jgi:hypothetical protein
MSHIMARLLDFAENVPMSEAAGESARGIDVGYCLSEYRMRPPQWRRPERPSLASNQPAAAVIRRRRGSFVWHRSRKSLFSEIAIFGE